ncbi:histidine phosphatase family protein [Gordonia sp. HY002]|nr:histidine phosphatase family protein [Gordonia zhenghanii]
MSVTVVVAGRTAPNRAVRFGGEHGELDRRGRLDVAGLTLPDAVGFRVGPETSVAQTAEILGVASDPDPSLSTLDVGRWRGLSPEAVAADLPLWFGDPDARPHGGETVREFVARIDAAIAEAADGDVLIVASPVAQALLCESAERYFTVDVRPASVLTVRHRNCRTRVPRCRYESG